MRWCASFWVRRAPRHQRALTYREAFLRRAARSIPSRRALRAARRSARAESASPQRQPSATSCSRFHGRGRRPAAGRDALTFVHGYPASQAALARLDPADPRAALRFELYCDGIELANGFHELASAREQRGRFERDIEERRRLGLTATALDERLLAALEAGLPECCGRRARIRSHPDAGGGRAAHRCRIGLSHRESLSTPQP